MIAVIKTAIQRCMWDLCKMHVGFMRITLKKIKIFKIYLVVIMKQYTYPILYWYMGHVQSSSTWYKHANKSGLQLQ